jgi:hypothetical protein
VTRAPSPPTPPAPPTPAAPAAPPATPPGPTAPPARPPLSDDEASTLLDGLIYEQVVACVDLDELAALEQTIVLLAGELDGVDPARAAGLATAVVDGALHRLPVDIRRYLDTARLLCEGCPLCEEEARASRSTTSGSRRAPRGKA